MSEEPRFTTLSMREVSKAIFKFLEDQGINIDRKVAETLYYDAARKQVTPDHVIVITDLDPGFIPGTPFKDE